MGDLKLAGQFNEIYASTYKAVLSFVTARCGNTADIGDIVQETYMELYQLLKKRGTDYIKNAHAITLKIAKQKLYRHYTLMERLKMFVPLTIAGENGDEVALSDLEAQAIWEDDLLFRQALLADVRQLIRQKPEDVKRIFILFYDGGLSIPEIAQALSLSESNVKNKLYRALKEMREKLN
jgi:RNA polymerase sigma-70 factor (ECF subfamily)